VQVKSNSPRRVGVDVVNNEIVVLDQTLNNVFHGHVREWIELTSDMKEALIRKGWVDKTGVIKR